MADDDSNDAQESKKKEPTRTQKGLRAAGKAMREQGQRTLERVAAEASARSDERSPNSQPRYVNVDSYKRGGKVRKTGEARLHKGEMIMKRGKKKRGGMRMRGRL